MAARTVRIVSALLLGTLLAAPAAQAQDDTETRLRQALRETGARLREAEAALAQQRLAAAALERERDALKAAAARPARPAIDPARLGELQRRLEHSRSEAAQAQNARRQTEQRLRQAESERDRLAAQLAQARERADRCAAGNRSLYETGRDLAALYRDPEFVAFVRKRGRELIGLDRVEQENRVRALEDRLAELHAQSQACRQAAGAAS